MLAAYTFLVIVFFVSATIGAFITWLIADNDWHEELVIFTMVTPTVFIALSAVYWIHASWHFSSGLTFR